VAGKLLVIGGGHGVGFGEGVPLPESTGPGQSFEVYDILR